MSSRRRPFSERRLQLGAGLCAVLAGGLSLEASAQESRLTLTPSITVSQSFDSDGVVLEDGEESNSLFEAIPAFRARAERPGTQLDFNVSTRTRSNSADSDLSAQDETGSFALRQSLGQRFTAIANGSFRSREAQDPLDSDDPVEIQVGRPDLHEATGDLTLAYSVTATSQVSFGYSAFARDFQGGESSRNGNRDVDVDAYTLGYSIQMSPLDRVGLSFTQQQLRFGTFDTGAFRRDDQNDQVTAIFAGWTRQLTPMWTADLTGGVRRLKTDGGGFQGLTSEVGDGAPNDDSTGFIGGLSLQRDTEWNRTRLAYRRETRPQGGVGTSLDVDSFELAFRQQLVRNLSLELRGDYQISKSASDTFFPTAPVDGFTFDGTDLEAVCDGGFSADVEGSPLPICLTRGGDSVDTNLLRLGAELNWRWTRGFVTFLSFDFRDQDTDGVQGGRDRNTSRVRLGFRYAYDYEVF